jgi:hypothetical protein
MMSRPPKTYAEAVDELGGQPWRPLDHTEQWFLDEEPPREPNTASFRIPRPSNRLWLGLGTALAVGLVALLVIPAAGLPSATAAKAPPMVTPPMVTRPAVMRPAVTQPVVTRPASPPTAKAVASQPQSRVRHHRKRR